MSSLSGPNDYAAPPSSDRPIMRSLVVTVCATVLLVGMTVSLPVSLYGQYAMLSGRGNGAFAVALACYGLSILPALFFFGGISDRIGRRLALEVALALSLFAIATISAFPTLVGLGVSRFAQGGAMGLVGASATAFLAESLPGTTAPVRAANYVSAMLALGYALGGLTTALCVTLGSTLFPLSYPAHMTACGLAILALTRLPDVADRKATPYLSLPFFPPGAVPFCLAICAAWSLMSVVLSILPIELGRHQLIVWSGLTTFLMPLAGLACQQLSRRLEPTLAVRFGLILAPAGCLLLALGIAIQHLELVLAGAVAAGAAGLGFIFQGGLATISILGGTEKARAAAGFFLACYLGLCLAPLAVGWISDHQTTSSALVLLAVFLAVLSVGIEVSLHMRDRNNTRLSAASLPDLGQVTTAHYQTGPGHDSGGTHQYPSRS